jgi:GNAT superfamily N-acetyltransferase
VTIVTAAAADDRYVGRMADGAWTRVDVTRTHLELRGREALRAAPPPAERVSLHLHRPIGAPEYRALYILVGEPWLWRDRLLWTDDELDAYLASPNVYVWTLSVAGRTAGYFELQNHANATVEVMYFGLIPAFIGRGIGGWMLTRAVEESLALGATRVILNTCTLDAPQALPNYLARGFSIVREETYSLDVPIRPAGDALGHANGAPASRG